MFEQVMNRKAVMFGMVMVAMLLVMGVGRANAATTCKDAATPCVSDAIAGGEVVGDGIDHMVVGDGIDHKVVGDGIDHMVVGDGIDHMVVGDGIDHMAESGIIIIMIYDTE